MISLTKLAIERIKKISEEEGIGHTQIRVLTKGGGCAGLMHDIYFEDNEASEFDEIFEHDGIKIVCDPLSYQYLNSAEIDFIEDKFASGFKVNNPNVSNTCGCGSSFSV